MSRAALIGRMVQRGIRLSVEGDHLRVKGQATEAELAELRQHKAEIVGLLRAAEAAGLSPELVHRLPADDIAACQGLPPETLGAYLGALDRGERMDRGEVPPGFTAARWCQGCGPVWLWPGAPKRLKGCPWCHRRKAGKPFPRPEA